MSLLLLFGPGAAGGSVVPVVPQTWVPGTWSGTLGNQYSRPGYVQPGYFFASTATWKGPFPMQWARAPWADANQIVYPDFTIFPVTTTIASQLAQSNPTIWEFH